MKVPALACIALTMLTVAGCGTVQSQAPKTAIHNVTQNKSHITNNLDFKTLFPDPANYAYAKKMIGTKAANFGLTDLADEQLTLNKYKGQDVVLEVALASCPVCIQTFPAVESFKKSHPDIKVITVFPFNQTSEVKGFFSANKYKVDDQVAAGSGMSSIASDYSVQYVPTFVFIDKEGYIQYTHIGDVDTTELNNMATLAFHLGSTK